MHLICRHPDFRNTLSFDIGSTNVVSMLDVAVWDMACHIPSLALIGSVEPKADPGRWKYPQLMGQLVGQRGRREEGEWPVRGGWDRGLGREGNLPEQKNICRKF
jgi:hypothetical protein